MKGGNKERVREITRRVIDFFFTHLYFTSCVWALDIAVLLDLL